MGLSRDLTIHRNFRDLSKNVDQLVWIPLFIDRLLGSPRWQGMKDFQRGWYMQLLLLCARSQRPGYLPSSERLWQLAGAHRRELWEQHKSAVMACFKSRTFDATEWIYNERLLYTIEHQRSKLSKSLELRDQRKFLSISTSYFSKPSIEEVRLYCEERHNSVSPEDWMNHYEANGWKVGRVAMKDWKAAVRTWEPKNGESRKHIEAKPENPDLCEQANPECEECVGIGYRGSKTKPGTLEPCPCTVARRSDRQLRIDDPLGAERTAQTRFEEFEETPSRALGAAANGSGKRAV